MQNHKIPSKINGLDQLSTETLATHTPSRHHLKSAPTEEDDRAKECRETLLEADGIPSHHRSNDVAAAVQARKQIESEEHERAAAKKEEKSTADEKAETDERMVFINVARPLPVKIPARRPANSPMVTPREPNNKQWGGYVGGFAIPYSITGILCLAFPMLALEIYVVGLVVSLASMILCRNVPALFIHQKKSDQQDIRTPSSTASAKGLLGITNANSIDHDDENTVVVAPTTASNVPPSSVIVAPSETVVNTERPTTPTRAL